MIFVPTLSGSQYVIAIFSGLLLAYCFQWLLTNLSVAIGISALQEVTDSGKREKRRHKTAQKEAEEKKVALRSSHPAGHEDEEGWEHGAVKMGSGIGLWAMV